MVSGCSLTHERGGGGDIPDTGPLLVADAFVFRPDAAVPPRVDAFVPFVMAPHGPATIVPNQGGRRLVSPQLVPIFFADDPDSTTLEAHAHWMATSSWLPTVGAEYGIGAATVLGVVRLPQAAPDTMNTAQMEALLAHGMADHTIPVPASGQLDEVLFILYFPAHTIISDPMIGTSCTAFGGYHTETTTSDGRAFSYAVIPSCGAFSTFLTDLEAREEAAAHEVIEAATDPLWSSSPGWALSQTGSDLSPWLLAGAELADLCEYRVGDYAVVREAGFIGPRVWSNAAAALNDRDPCVPAPLGEPYQSVTVTPSTIQGVAAGGRITFAVDAWSNVAVPSFRLDLAFNPASTMGQFVPDATLDRNIVNNGEHAVLTVTVPTSAVSGDYGVVYIQVTDSVGNSDDVPVGVYAL